MQCINAPDRGSFPPDIFAPTPWLPRYLPAAAHKHPPAWGDFRITQPALLLMPISVRLEPQNLGCSSLVTSYVHYTPIFQAVTTNSTFACVRRKCTFRGSRNQVMHGRRRTSPDGFETLIRKPSPKIEIPMKFRTQNNAQPAPYRRPSRLRGGLRHSNARKQSRHKKPDWPHCKRNVEQRSRQVRNLFSPRPRTRHRPLRH